AHRSTASRRLPSTRIQPRQVLRRPKRILFTGDIFLSFRPQRIPSEGLRNWRAARIPSRPNWESRPPPTDLRGETGLMRSNSVSQIAGIGSLRVAGAL